jgi:hypothetical protein
MAGIIEVTPEMIEAGVDVYLECDREQDPWEQIVSQVFMVMWTATPRQTCARV